MVRRAIGPLLGWDAAEHDAAYARAEQLLRDSLTPEQLAFYTERGYLSVPSKLYPGRTYRVDGWRPVAVFEDGEFTGAICLRPREHLPGPDVVLARKLLIEGAEESFLEAGNWLSPAWRPASAAPTILLVIVVLIPWLFQAHPVLGSAGAIAALLAVVVSFVLAARRRARQVARRRRRAPA